MFKAIAAFFLTIITGIFVDMLGTINNSQDGTLFAIAIMGALIIYSIENKK